MPEFRNPFFKSTHEKTEESYTNGVLSLQREDFYAAAEHFEAAARGDHISAIYNLSVLYGLGEVSPYQVDRSAEFWYLAASHDHPQASADLWLIEAADRGGFGYDNFPSLLAKATFNRLPGIYMVCAARFTSVLCKKYGATDDVIAYEIDAARQSDLPAVAKFVARTGISHQHSDGGLNRLSPGSAADQITDGLNKFCVALARCGIHRDIVTMARCTITGYVISKSAYSSRSKPLLGIDKFFL